MTRRSMILGSAGLAACRRKRGAGFGGYAFVANEEGEAITAVDLTAFAVARHIRIRGKPNCVLAHARLPAIYALTPPTGSVHEIGAENLAFRRAVHVARAALSMRLSTQNDDLWVLCSEPRQLVRVPLRDFRVETRIPLPDEPADFDLTEDVSRAVVSFPGSGTVGMVHLGSGRLAWRTRLEHAVSTVRFRSDGRQILAGAAHENMLSILDSASGRVTVHLPLALRPRCFCFKSDGGQLFITGEGMDAVVVVYPYQTQVAETVLAGHRPGYMAAVSRPGYLFTANPESGRVTVLDIETRRVAAVTSVGADPGFIAITPDNQYALILNRGSGDMAVIRIASVVMNRYKTAPLFTMIPVGSRPVSATVRAV